ncbi:MAG TPA: type I DNA topoisomerase [Terriglobales bacterium]|nr:type I DNA topoisomerase [Terriglobales bacterium]
MAKSLVIVESPGKAKTINKYLGPDFKVVASIGHIMDLPKRDLGVDIENHFKPTYVVIPGKEKVLNELKREAKLAKAIYLAADPDREGEAICFHLAHELDAGAVPAKKGAKAVPEKLMKRVAFNEITKRGVQEGFAHPGEIDQNLVDAYQARRALDRIVGYQISPLLWDRVRRGISAGRVQTPALRLVVEREALIKAFVKQEYWTLDAHLSAGKAPYFDARLTRKYLPDGTAPKEELEVGDAGQAGALRAALEGATYTVRQVETKERKRNPLPPFITSKLQQDASRKLRFSVKRTMMLAQRLYEGIEIGAEGMVGLITYMRTDSTRVSEDALVEARQFIGEQFGATYLPELPNRFASKKGAQDAHEAIRPTSALRDPESVKKYLGDDEFKVYKLIWQRFVASQMPSALFDQTAVEIEARAAGGDRYQLRTTGSVLKFDGFLKIYEESKDKSDDEDEALKHKLPPLAEKQALKLLSLKDEQHFTEPPPRYTEASLVKELEEKGIGRPSTYATILSTIQDRGYVTKTGGKFHPTELGTVVNELLTTNFKDIFELQYTARMEEKLDEIEEGRESWTDTLAEFYKRFSANLDYAEKHMQDYKRMETPTEHVCEKCGKPMVIRWGKHGSFLACSGYPECTNTREVALELSDLDSADVGQEKEEYCENCGRPMVLKRGRFGQFWACTGYPDCKTTRRLDAAQQKQPDRTLDEPCPQCGKNLVIKNGRFGEFTACSGYPACKYVKQNLVEGFKCPKCHQGDVAEKRSKRGKTFYSCTRYPDCDFSVWQRPVPEACPKCQHPYLLKKFLKAGPVIACPNEGCDYERPAEEGEAAAG